LLFDTTVQASANAQVEKYTYQGEYEWLGFTARKKIFTLLNGVLNDRSLIVDVFAYDLNEPDILKILLSLAKEGRIRIILDDSKDHHNEAKPKAEDQFEQLFNGAAGRGKTLMKRGMFRRYAHDKVFIVYKNPAKPEPLRVLTGSTNFSVTGLYVNSNHVLVFNDPKIASLNAGVFAEVWESDINTASFEASKWSTEFSLRATARLQRRIFHSLRMTRR
jgi:phosphatidylserine/phosphatidylglycerophosphate/cardiolipin synthase-like enzyme